MKFQFSQKILFRHCDPAGIVFYPRYFEMVNDCVEEFFDCKLKWPFAKMLQTSGVPTVSTSTDFQSTSRQGDLLLMTLNTEKPGRTSLKLSITAHCGNELRFSNTTTLVHVNLEGTPTPWPDEIVEILNRQEQS